MTFKRVLCVSTAAATLASQSLAAPLNLTPGFPALVFDANGQTSFDAATGVLTATASPIAIQFSEGAPPRFVNPTGNPASETVRINIRVAADGSLIGGTAGDDLLVVGQVDADGNGTIDFSGTLLTGEIEQFGFVESGQTDVFEFRFEATGGALLGTFAGGDIALQLTIENSTFNGSFEAAFAGGAKGTLGATPNEECPPPGTTRYRLHNHPDGEVAAPFYGLRLDELFNVTSGHDIFTFDFDHPESAVYMDVTETTIFIFGRAYGGLDTGTTYGNPNFAGVFEFEFLYDKGVMPAPGDDDIIVDTVNFANSGFIRATFGPNQNPISLVDYRGSFPFSFRLGDEDDDQGHRGFDGISGWGWLNHGGKPHVMASDWLFTAEITNECIPVEPEAAAPPLVLFVVPNPKSLNSQDKARRDELVNAGFQVMLVGELDPVSCYTAACELADVAYITENVLSTNVGKKLTTAPIGVVNEETHLVDELCVGSKVGGVHDGKKLKISGGSHPITQGLSGTITIAKSSTELSSISSGLTSGAVVLGRRDNSSSTPMLIAIERGAKLSDGSTAAGRRVQLPWGGNEFEFKQLNSTGKSLLIRSLEWAAEQD